MIWRNKGILLEKKDQIPFEWQVPQLIFWVLWKSDVNNKNNIYDDKLHSFTIIYTIKLNTECSKSALAIITSIFYAFFYILSAIFW